MRLFAVAALAVTAFIATIAVGTTGANAVVYCKRVGYPKGCVVRPPVHHRVVYCKRVGYPKGCVMRR
jgi:hypothetical protein